MIKLNRGCLLLLLLVSSLGAPAAADKRSCQASIAAMEPNASGFLSNSDDLLLPDQEVMNCFMWQTFAALNWPASQQQPLTGVSVR
ncbi:hypothetical protein [Vibrio sp. CAU 1672]|uniref:hypothetical protein n=1 Tax=Vibrio sp. CAU 1672 TaxID=3032594 RepID=UPI0023DB7AE3|nr:hypothetical protein [Vibrio sp. CAU 1672]MDF2153836.1 hypothetical protein [Vibrio sp. CAU 1672]